jgi:precorrin-2/cobalt-factor-2 C20-methyltransferase
VLPGTLAETELVRRLADADAVAIMKIGRHLSKVRRALRCARRLERAVYVERGSMRDGVTMRLAEKPDDTAPYFATVLVPGWQER